MTGCQRQRNQERASPHPPAMRKGRPRRLRAQVDHHPPQLIRNRQEWGEMELASARTTQQTAVLPSLTRLSLNSGCSVRRKTIAGQQIDQNHGKGRGHESTHLTANGFVAPSIVNGFVASSLTRLTRKVGQIDCGLALADTTAPLKSGCSVRRKTIAGKQIDQNHGKGRGHESTHLTANGLAASSGSDWIRGLIPYGRAYWHLSCARRSNLRTLYC